MTEGKDPFGSLIKFCQATSSQELKFQTCSFAREFDTFPDYFDSLATSSPDATPLDPVGIVIVSPPETDSENNSSIDKSNSQENENFLTPPEHHNPSASSSQEDPQRLKPVTPGDSKGSASVVAETTFGDDGRVENEVSINLGKGEKNLGFSETEKIGSRDEVSEGQCWDGVTEVEGIGRYECELKRFRSAFDSELNKPMSKKIRVLEENWNSEIDDKMNDTEIIDLDTEKIDEKIQFDKGKIIIDVDTLVEEVSGNDDGDVDQRENEKGVDLDGGDKCLKINGILILEKSEEGVRDNYNNEVQRDGKTVSGSSIKEKHGKFRCGGPGNGINSSVNERVARCRHELKSSTKEKDMGGEESIGNTEEVQKPKNSSSGSDINHREKEKDVASNGGDTCLKVNGTSALAESEERIRYDSDSKVHRNGKAVLGSIEQIEKFRYEGRSKGVDHSGKNRVARGRRELPSSIRGNEEDMGGEESDGYIKVKNGSWKDLVDALEVVFGKVDDSCEDVDFLETAKRRGLTFPQPRWI